MARTAAGQKPIELGPFGGVYDATAPGSSRPTRLFQGTNIIVPDPKAGSEVAARHGFLGLTTQLGSGSERQAQGAYVHRRNDGTIDRFTFGGGKMYQWDGADTYTDITPAGVLIDPTNPVFGLSFADEFVVSDETNTPWVYTPDDGTADLIYINAALDPWCSKGGPQPFAGKVFFIRSRTGTSHILTEDDDIITTEAADGDDEITTELLGGFQNTIIWCEEGDVRTGYLQDGFQNFRALTQSGDDILGCIIGQETYLLYFRNTGMSLFTGSVNEDFRSAATADVVSSTLGTNTPAAVMVINRRIWFADMDGRVHRVTADGTSIEELYFPMRRAIEAAIGTAQHRTNLLRYARVGYHDGDKVVVFTLWDDQTTYVFDVKSGQFLGNWPIGGAPGESIHITALANMVDAQGRSTFCVFGTRDDDSAATNHGVLWRQKHPDDDNQWLDQADASSDTCVPLTRSMTCEWIGGRANTNYQFSEVVAELIGDVARHAVALTYTTPRGTSTPLVAQSSIAIGDDDTDRSVSMAAWSLGRNAQGRGMRFTLSATHSDNVRWGVHNISATAKAVPLGAGAR